MREPSIAKLTLSIEEPLIRTAKRFARSQGTSVSRLVSAYFRSMGRRKVSPDDLPPITRRMTGIIKVPKGMSDRELIEDALAHHYGLRE